MSFDHQDILAPRLLAVKLEEDRGNRTPHNFLELLRQLSGDNDIPLAKGGSYLFESFDDAVRGFIQNDRSQFRAQNAQLCLSSLFYWKESFKHESLRWKPAYDKCRYESRWPRYWNDWYP